MASKTAQGWPGAPAFYLPLGLVIALFLWGWSWLLAAGIRLRFDWSRDQLSPAPDVMVRIPGIVGVYCSYVGGVAIARKRWRIDPRLATVSDVGAPQLSISFSPARFLPQSLEC